MELANDDPFVYVLGMSTATQATTVWMLHIAVVLIVCQALCMLPKLCVDVNQNEFVRYYRLLNAGFPPDHSDIEVTSLYLRRVHDDAFWEELYPDTPSSEPAMTAEEYFNGETRDPKLISLRDKFKPPEERNALFDTKIPNPFAEGTTIQAAVLMGTSSHTHLSYHQLNNRPQGLGECSETRG